MTIEFNDDLADILAAPVASRVVDPAKVALADAISTQLFEERCPKCGGTGTFRSWSGRLLGKCHPCHGTGKLTFKHSFQERQASRDYSRDLHARKVAAWKIANPEVTAWFTGNEFPFAVAMAEAVEKYGSLTDRQLAASQKCVAALVAKRDASLARAAVAPSINIDRVEVAFEKAVAYGIKRPRLNLDAFTFKPAGSQSRNPGAVYVVEGENYLGKIQAGKFVCSGICTPDQQTRILAAAADPEAAAVAYGRRTGQCAVCRRTLTVGESIDRGIGPVCAERMGW